VRIQLMSDLHFEFHPDGGKSFVDSLDPDGVDVLVLAGDIGVVKGGSLHRGFDLLATKYRGIPIIFLMGNHELYGSSPDWAEEQVDALTKDHPNLHWLENNTVEIGGQRFVGSTLWFPNLPDGQNTRFSRGLNDFHLIYDFQQWVYDHNAASVEFLTREVQPGDVVVTHHIPTVQGVHPRWLHDVQGFGRFFLSQMPDDVLQRPKLWFYGHTHDSMDFEIGGCRFLCNPFGYVRREENPRFNPKLLMGV